MDSNIILILLAAVVGAAAVWYVRGWWDNRQQTILPRAIVAATAAITELAKLKTPDPATAADAQVLAQANAVRLQALKDAAAKLGT